MSDEQRPERTGSDFHTQLDRAARVTIAKATGGLAPSTLITAATDWALHLASAPGTQMKLWESALHGALALGKQALGAKAPASPAQDPRFRSELWQKPPYALMRDAFLMTEDWWQSAITDVRGMAPGNQAALNFAVRQALDVAAPSNFPFLNPEVLERTRQTHGDNLVQGVSNLVEDLPLPARPRAAREREFKVGENLAMTPGKVVARTHLMELIQYSPTTAKVRPEPVLIVPAWIMKYYILDLTAKNSLVRWLVGQGFTVFMISWHNPGPEDRCFGMEDYLAQGPLAALDAVQAITGAKRIHAAGYCLGGTLLALAATDLARRGDGRLASLTLLAAQVDFSEAGELGLFISEAQVALLEDMMWDEGYLGGEKMAGAFTLLRSNDLLWSRLIHQYMMGERPVPNDLMVWNSDTTRMPYRMHSEYLRGMFLENRLSNNKYKIGDKPVSLTDIHIPVLAVGTETDHVAPWRSVFKIHNLTESEVSFILTSGGHNAGIVSEPGHPNRHFRFETTPHEAPFKDPDTWIATNPKREGSWWPAWAAWLAERSGPPGAPPQTGNAEAGYPVLDNAPGTYIFQR